MCQETTKHAEHRVDAREDCTTAEITLLGEANDEIVRLGVEIESLIDTARATADRILGPEPQPEQGTVPSLPEATGHQLQCRIGLLWSLSVKLRHELDRLRRI